LVNTRVLFESAAFLKLSHSAYSSFDNGSFNEKIGVVIGSANIISDAVEATGESTPAFCTLDHERVFGVHRRLREGDAIIGWYHTHDGSSTPSRIDEDIQSNWQAFEGTLSVIVDVRHAQIAVWRTGSDGIEEVQFAVVPTVQKTE